MPNLIKASRAIRNLITDHMAEIGYVGFSIANIFADSNVKNHLFNFRSTITSQQAALLHSSKSDQFWRFAYPAATLTSN
ncbi:hypothetical protein [Piscirickettsia salmonis]|uniref:hypothetical protein n=1 Tax=Piscirickettsia salmonis TaxID=1238 RepID=UPI0012B7C193|nr:hypothetical protein [Piscirickettsia salmonis]